MTPEDPPVTHALVEALIGQSHAKLRGETQTALAELSGKVDVLAIEQRRARETSSREHAVSQATADRIERKLDGALERIDAVEGDNDQRRAVERWRRWALGAATGAGGLLIAVVGLVLTHAG